MKCKCTTRFCLCGHTLVDRKVIQAKRNTPYEGDDIADWVKQNRTYHTPSQAFRDAKYSEWFEKDTEMSDMKLFACELMLVALPAIIVTIVLVVCVFKVVGVFN